MYLVPTSLYAGLLLDSDSFDLGSTTGAVRALPTLALCGLVLSPPPGLMGRLGAGRVWLCCGRGGGSGPLPCGGEWGPSWGGPVKSVILLKENIISNNN